MKPTRVLLLGALLSPVAKSEFSEDRLSFITNHGSTIPLVGIGVGNLATEYIPDMLKLAVGLEVRFVDTAMASRNEALIAQTLAESGSGSASGVHVQTKVWYTHLGYARTQLAVRNSLANFATSPGPPPTVLLHWPRCRSDVPWMRCEEEENELPDDVKAIGPPPPDDAWEGSWAALEDAFLSGDVSNIGVSNFDAAELQRLLTIARVKPHLLQGNLWSVVFDPALINLCNTHGILFQAYNVMNGATSIEAQYRAPRAAALLRRVGRDLGSPGRSSSGNGASNRRLDASEVVVAWLTQRGIGVIPRTSNPAHMMANAPRTVAAAPRLTTDEADDVMLAVRCLLGGSDREMGPQTPEETAFAQDEEEAARTGASGGGGGGARSNDQANMQSPVTATFRNSLSTKAPRDDASSSAAAAALAVSVYWLHHETGDLLHAAGPLAPGEEAAVSTWPGHRFVAKAATESPVDGGGGGEAGAKGKHYSVSATAGQEQYFHIDEL